MSDLGFSHSADLVSALRGDLAAFERLRGHPPWEPVGDGALVVTASAVARVLGELRDGAAPERVRAWASFARWGVVAPAAELPIDFEPAREDAIVEALARMDELGDAVDGDLSATEIDELIESLGRDTHPWGREL